MESKFKVGDRVAVYGYARIAGQRTGMCPYLRGSRGVVEQVVTPDELLLKSDDRETLNVHVKQCRRLKKRDPKKRVWMQRAHANAVPFSAGVNPLECWARVPNDSEEWVEFIEVRRKVKP